MTFLDQILTHHYTQASEADCDKHTQGVREAALSAGWPPVVAIQLYVVLVDGMFEVRCPPGLKDTVELLEYGTESIRPNPAIRNYLRTIPTQREVAA
jgi:hypothetical protein